MFGSPAFTVVPAAWLLLAPGSLDTQHCVTVDRRLTGSTGGQWMLAAIDASGYAAYTRPGSYDTYACLLYTSHRQGSLPQFLLP